MRKRWIKRFAVVALATAVSVYTVPKTGLLAALGLSQTTEAEESSSDQKGPGGNGTPPEPPSGAAPAVIIPAFTVSDPHFYQISNETDQITKGNQDVLFERFYRSDASRNSATGGSGIGLSVAKAVAEAHHGKLTAESKDGKSLTITLTVGPAA